MKELAGRTAVVTGAATDIGRALAQRFAREGMNVVLADAERDALEVATRELEGSGAPVLGVHVDVSRPDEVEKLAGRALEAFGGAHVVCNHASVSSTARFANTSLEEWRRTWDVNFRGVLNGCRTFLPILRSQGEGHVVNTSALSALDPSLSGSVPYTTSKLAVLGLTELLFHELALENEPLGISVLCPAGVGPDRRGTSGEGRSEVSPPLAEASAAGELVVGAIRDERFFVLSPDPEEARAAAEEHIARLGGALPLTAGIEPDGATGASSPPVELSGRVAVVTGAASGIGRGLAEECTARGMKVVLADLDEAGLDRAVGELTAAGAEAVGVPTDVSRPDDVEALARRALEAFGAVHLVCNNAGVESGAMLSDIPLELWDWVHAVNVWGVVHGCRTFLPVLEEQEFGHLVNTASMAAFNSAIPTFAPYITSKFAVVGLSESLRSELERTASRVRVSVFCPGVVASRLPWSEERRPAGISVDSSHPARRSIMETLRGILDAGRGMSAGEAAEIVLRGVCENRFFLLTHPEAVVQLALGRLSWMLTNEPLEPPRYRPPVPRAPAS